MTFEWDENKNDSNKKKHGISFEIAVRVFLDPNVIVVPDPEASASFRRKLGKQGFALRQERYQAIGMVEEVLFVVFTERASDCIRIISARPATQEEINEYYENYDAR